MIFPTKVDGLLGDAVQVATGPSEADESRACWSEIGVYGNNRCSELAKFTHCRNCPVYSSAGVQLLNRPLPSDYRREWSEHFSQRKKLLAHTNASAVLFRLGAEWFALPTEVLQEVAERRRIHSLPHRRQSIVLGLANVRGELLICVSLGHLLGLEKLPSRELLRTSHDRLLVIQREGARLVFPVDEIPGTQRFNLQDLVPVPATVAKSNASYSKGLLYWKERPVGYLDAQLLFAALNRSLT